MSDTQHQHPEIEKLLNLLRNDCLLLNAIPASANERSKHFRRIEIRWPDASFEVPVEDDYGDVREGAHPAMLLHLVLRTCRDYDEAEDYLVWCKDLGFDASDPYYRELHQRLGEFVPDLLERVAGRAEPLSDWDFEMNTGVTQALRTLSQEGSL